MRLGDLLQRGVFHPVSYYKFCSIWDAEYAFPERSKTFHCLIRHLCPCTALRENLRFAALAITLQLDWSRNVALHCMTELG